MPSKRSLAAVAALALAACSGSKDPSRYTVGGTVTGLAGSGLVLQNSGGDDLAIAANGAFSFATQVVSGGTFHVTVKDQPTTPWQTCTVSGGDGTVVSGAVTSVTVNCATNRYAIGGTISGLAGGGLVLQNSGGDDLAVSANGTFAFATTVESGAAFAVTVRTQPTNPWQTCTVASGTGNVASGAVSTVVVTCATDAYAVGGTVTGLAGTGLVLANGADAVAVAADGSFALPAVTSGATYDVTVKTQPTSPWQTCTVANGQGTVAGAAIADVAVTCTTNSYRLGGTVAGLAGTGLALQEAGGDVVAPAANGPFAFGTPVASGAAYEVTVRTQPSSPTQTCVVSGGAGVVGGGDVGSVTVNCTTDAFAVGGTVSGLAGTGLVLQDLLGDDLPIGANGGFAFATPVASGAPYDVTVKSQPTSPWQTCAVTAGSGTVGAGPVTSVGVECTTNRYVVAATVAGLAGGGLVLQLNGGGDLAIAANGTAAFATTVESGAAYAVTVSAQPTSPWQTCAASAGTGTVLGGDVTVAVTCTTNAYSIGGNASGVLASGLTLQNSGGAPLAIDANGPFTFPATVESGQAYSVAIASQPPTQICSLSNAAGTVAGANVTDVAASCTCQPLRANCDGVASNGCEASLTSLTSCGACGKVCASVPNGGPTCTSGTCGIGWCNAGWADCDQYVGDGCEINVTTDRNNCGGCGKVCVAANATTACTASTCAIATCNAGFLNCDALYADGCEVNTQTDSANCGGCGIVCAAGSACAAGTCTAMARTFTNTSTGAGGSIQTYTLPWTGIYRIDAYGAQGGSGEPAFAGGRGAEIRGDFSLSAGTVVRVLVGQQGTSASGSNGGGGGGSFVATSSGTLLVVAGGGGGLRFAAAGSGQGGLVTTYGGAGWTGASVGSGTATPGGTAGSGGSVSSSWGSAGGGYTGAGANDGSWGYGGQAFSSGGAGGGVGTSVCGGAAPGGFGGGGAGNGCDGGGGGGGYSGGGGGFVAGGGGSYNGGTNPYNAANVRLGHGTVIITRL